MADGKFTISELGCGENMGFSFDTLEEAIEYGKAMIPEEVFEIHTLEGFENDCFELPLALVYASEVYVLRDK